MPSSTDAAGGPWPEPDDDLVARAERAGADAADTARELDVASARVVDELDDIDDLAASGDERTGAQATTGSRGVAIAVAGVNVAMLLILPVLIVVGIYAFITIYAIVKAVTDGSDAADPRVILLGVVGLVTLFTLAIGLAGWAIGRVADPRKRR